jgi:hypothetical protein
LREKEHTIMKKPPWIFAPLAQDKRVAKLRALPVVGKTPRLTPLQRVLALSIKRVK